MLNIEKAKEMKESGIDISFDDSELDPDDRRSGGSSTASTQSSPGGSRTSSRPKANLTGRNRQRLRFQSRLILLKQQHEQSQESQKIPRKFPQSSGGSSLNSLPSVHLANRDPQRIERRPKGSNCEQSVDFVNSPLSSEVQMKFNLLKTSLSSDMGYADDASPASSTTSMSEMSESDQILLGNVVEVKAVDELPEEISELLCRASYSEGYNGLMQSKKVKADDETSLSCPSETAAQPKYRGGRRKEAPPANMTTEQRAQWEKERQKKDNHNHIERRRRDKINDCIRLLALIVPNGDDNFSNSLLVESGSHDAQKKEYNKKGAVLEAAVNYIKRLQSEQKQMEECRKQQEILQRANRSLMLEIQQLQNRAQQVHISSPHLSPPVQQVMLHQYQQQFEAQPCLDQEHLQHADMQLGSVQLLMSPGHPHVSQIEIQQQHQQLLQNQETLFLDELVNFVQESSSEIPPLVATGNCHFGQNQFETISDSVFLDQPESNFQELALMDHSFIDIIPDQPAAVNDYSVDDFFNVQTVQLNGDPLLSNANDELMASDFDDLFIPLALR